MTDEEVCAEFMRIGDSTMEALNNFQRIAHQNAIKINGLIKQVGEDRVYQIIKNNPEVDELNNKYQHKMEMMSNSAEEWKVD